MNNKEMYYREGIGGWIMLTNLYLENIGWVWDRDEMDYVTDDIDLVHYTLLVEGYIADVSFEIDDEDLIGKVIATCKYNDEEELIKAIRLQLNMCLDQELADLGDYIKEEVRRALLCSRVYEDIKSKVDGIIGHINMRDKIYTGITNTEWKGTKSDLTTIIRQGLKVTNLYIKKRSRNRSYTDWMVPAVDKSIRRELYKNGYTATQVEDMIRGIGNEIKELVSERRWACESEGIEIKVLIVPLGLNGFDKGDRFHFLTGDTYRYLKDHNLVY